MHTLFTQQPALLKGKRRTMNANIMLGRSLAFVAGAINAGGFLVVQHYTSHMTGVLSLVADSVVLNAWHTAIVLLAYVGCFIVGSVTTTVLILWAKERKLHCRYAFPLAIEAVLLLCFGIMGSVYMQGVVALLSWLVALLCYLMGLQNAVITKISSATIRTTHMTGMVTDIGIALGRLLYTNKTTNPHYRAENREKLLLHLSVVLMFLTGGITGAYGFKHMGFLAVLPLSFYLLWLSFVPIGRDIRIIYYRWRRRRRY